MVKIKIDNKEIAVKEGSTILEAANKLGIDIPTMCHLEGGEHITSCMVCMVKDIRNGRLMPSCSMPAMSGMEIVTNDDECREARKAALELLLSEHVGDCEAPCQNLCPAHMDIPKMNRYIAKGDYDRAIEVIRKDIAIPAILGRICPAPCEAGCRRKPIDGAVSICLLKGFAADTDLNKQPKRKSPGYLSGSASPKSIAIIGAGPAGLAAAYYLDLAGHKVSVYEKNKKPGGALLSIGEEKLPGEVMDKEINYILGTEINLSCDMEVDKTIFNRFRKEYDAVIIANGGMESTVEWGMDMTNAGIAVDQSTYETSLKNVFAVGNALRAAKVAIRSVGQSKELAAILDRYFSTGKLVGNESEFNSKFGKLVSGEFAEYMKDSIDSAPVVPFKGKQVGFSEEEAVIEAKRCMHCDCRKIDNCRLRDLSGTYNAKQKRFSYGDRRLVTRVFGSQNIVFEENKCIRCGKCIQITRQEQEKYGFTYIGRGFDVKIGVPFSESLEKALIRTASKVIENCPTGALSSTIEH